MYMGSIITIHLLHIMYLMSYERAFKNNLKTTDLRVKTVPNTLALKEDCTLLKI